jgi:hypothetical protein
MPGMAGKPGGAGLQAAVDHQATANACRNREERKIAKAAAGADAEFGPGRRLRIVDDQRR